MKIWHFSDTHGYHERLFVPKNIDVAIFSGDCSNYRSFADNSVEVQKFLDWYSQINIAIKIMIAGNHDTSIEAKIFNITSIDDLGITYLENSDVSVNGLKIWGSPYTPTFANWAFMKARHKMSMIWNMIPKDTDILVTHGPPKGILDLNTEVERCGCNALRNKIFDIKPTVHLFGHVHNNRNLVLNAGTFKASGVDTLFSNGSVVVDGDFGGHMFNGNVVEVNL